VPGTVLADVVTVIVLEPEPVTVVGENVAPAPAGNPVALKVTTPAKPFSADTVAV
jgi:hypothetical protein